MDWKGPACLLVVIIGVFLFLFGANHYSNFAGWAGVYLFVGGILAYVVLWVYSHLHKRGAAVKPVQKP